MLDNNNRFYEQIGGQLLRGVITTRTNVVALYPVGDRKRAEEIALIDRLFGEAEDHQLFPITINTDCLPGDFDVEAIRAAFNRIRSPFRSWLNRFRETLWTPVDSCFVYGDFEVVQSSLRPHLHAMIWLPHVGPDGAQGMRKRLETELRNVFRRDRDVQIKICQDGHRGVWERYMTKGRSLRKNAGRLLQVMKQIRHRSRVFTFGLRDRIRAIRKQDDVRKQTRFKMTMMRNVSTQIAGDYWEVRDSKSLSDPALNKSMGNPTATVITSSSETMSKLRSTTSELARRETHASRRLSLQTIMEKLARRRQTGPP